MKPQQLLRYGIPIFFAFIVTALVPAARATLINSSLLNSGFESPVIGKKTYSIMNESSVPGWDTTATDHMIEIWSTGFNGVSAYEGNQFAELDANQQATLFEDVSGIAANMKLDFSFAHRGRAAVESMRFTITDLGADGLMGTKDDTTLFSKIYSDGTSAWGYYTSASEKQILSTGNTIRVSFDSLTPGSVGNFLDAVDLNVAAGAPEPGTWATLLLLSFASCGPAVLRGIRRPVAGC